MHILGIPVYFLEKAVGFEADERGDARKMGQKRFSGEQETVKTYPQIEPRLLTGRRRRPAFAE